RRASRRASSVRSAKSLGRIFSHAASRLSSRSLIPALRAGRWAVLGGRARDCCHRWIREMVDEHRQEIDASSGFRDLRNSSQQRIGAAYERRQALFEMLDQGGIDPQIADGGAVQFLMGGGEVESKTGLAA